MFYLLQYIGTRKYVALLKDWSNRRMLYKSYIALLYVRNMHKNIEKATYITVAAILASMVLIPSTIIWAQAQGTPLVSKADQSISVTKMSGMNMAAASSGTSNLTTTRDSVTVLLEGKTLPGKGFIHLYDSTPYMILNGHVALHVPCNSNSEPDVEVLMGPAPNFTKVQPEIIQGGLSHPGQMCLYHADINSDPSKKLYQTDIAIANPTNQTIIFPPTSSVVIGVNGIMPGVPGG